jgi:PadR family transcriptional regulator PadR
MTHKPLTQRTFYLLLALHDGPLHGYAIRKRVLELSDGVFELEPGGLYRRIARLERDGLIEPAAPPPEVESHDERRRYYRLTKGGQRALEREASRLAGLVERPEVATILGGR